MRSKKKGFTIIELVIVIAVIGVLSAILIPTFSGITGKAEEAVRQENLRNAMVKFQTDAVNGHMDANEDVALPQNVTEKDMQMTMDGTNYVFDNDSQSWVPGEFKAVEGYGARGRINPKKAVDTYTIDQLGPHDIPYDPLIYKLMWVGANFRGYSNYGDCLVRFLALISEYADYINNSVSDESDYTIATIAQNEKYAEFLYNKGVSSDREDGFKKHEGAFLVGDDNSFEFKPKVVIVDGDGNPAAEANWTQPFTVTVEKKVGSNFVAADPALYSLPETLTIDNLKIDFADEAVGETFRITTAPTGLPEKRVKKFTQSLEVDVIDGFNVYRGLDLAYVDDTVDGVKMSWSPSSGEAYGSVTNWETFKTSKGLSTTYHPSNFIFQDNVKITKADFPSEFIYPAESPKAGSLINDAAIYRVLSSGTRHVTLHGNFFQLDCSAIPLVTIGVEEASTATLFQPGHHASQEASSITFKNLNVTGNSRYVTDNSGAAYVGGLTLAKTAYACEHITFDNVLARNFFQTAQAQYRMMSSISAAVNADSSAAQYSDVRIYDCKFTDNYNAFIYSYGGHVHAERTYFHKCGGPIIIQDHVNYRKWFESNPTNSLFEDGAPIPWIPRAFFTDCVFDNYVVGTEAWFLEFDQDAMIYTMVRPISDQLYKEFGQSFILDPTFHAGVDNSANPNAVMNFVALNKGVGVGASSSAVCGEVVITNTAAAVTEHFDYAEGKNSVRGEIQTRNQRTGAQMGLSPVFQNGDNFIGLDYNEDVVPTILNGKLLPESPTDDSFYTYAGPHTGMYIMGMMMVLGMVHR